MPSSSKKRLAVDHDASSTIVSTHNSEHWMERATGKMSKSLNKLLTKTGSCARLCSVYAEEQLAYENRQDSDYVTSMDRILSEATGRAASSVLEVDLYRQFLFDEESVMESFHQVEEHHHVVHHPAPAPSESGVGDVYLNHDHHHIMGAKSNDSADRHTILTQRSN